MVNQLLDAGQGPTRPSSAGPAQVRFGVKLRFQKKKNGWYHYQINTFAQYNRHFNSYRLLLLLVVRLHQVLLQHDASGHSRLCASFYLISDGRQYVHRCRSTISITPFSTLIAFPRDQQSKAYMAGYEMRKVEILQLLQAFRSSRWLYCQCNSLKCHSNLTSYCFWWLQLRTCAAFCEWWEMPKSVETVVKVLPTADMQVWQFQLM